IRNHQSRGRLDSGNCAKFTLDFIGGAAGCVQDQIPGALSVLKGAVPGLARGLGHMAPTYFVGTRERCPTAIPAPDERRCQAYHLANGTKCFFIVFSADARLTMPLNKAALRAQALLLRTETTIGAAAGFALQLAEIGLALAMRWHPQVASAYFPLPNEPSTLPLLEHLTEAGIKTALPVTGKRGTPLVFRLWRPGEPTAKGKMKIEEPLAQAPEVSPDLLFVPLAAFDRAGNRIGYGAGYYDRTLRQLRAMKPICAVGVAYAAQEFPGLPTESHDESLDYVLTERELIDCRAQ